MTHCYRRKRLKRLFAKEQILTTITGSQIGDEDNGKASIVASGKSAKGPVKAETFSTTKSTKKPKATVKKRKVAEMKDQEAAIKTEDGADMDQKNDAE
jgi:hypothetical protein